jgi:histidine triad (HIT) family protein
MQYDAQNIFARIIRGEIPSSKIYEDEDVLAFMDVMPQIEGHCLVVPKQGCRNLLDADPAILTKTISATQKIARAAMKAFNADGVQIRQYSEPAAGQTVFHLHFHILPMRDGDTLKPHSGKMADATVLQLHAERIRAAL